MHPQCYTARWTCPLAGNNQRGTRFVDEDGVHLVDDGEIVPALHFVFLIDDHVVAQVVEAELVVRTIGNVGIVSLWREALSISWAIRPTDSPRKRYSLPIHSESRRAK